MPQRPLDETGQRFEMAGVRESESSVPGWLKIAAGCGCALVLSAAVVVGGLGAGLRWLFGSGEQVPAAWIAGPASPGAFATEAIGDDAGFAAFVTELIAAIDRVQRESVAAEGRWSWLEDLEQQGEAAELESLGDWLPTDAALALEHGPAGVEVVGAVNLPRFGRLVHTLVKGATEATDPVGDHDVRRDAGGTLFGFAGGTLLVASGRTALERALERIDARREAGGGPEAAVPGEGPGDGALGAAKLAGLAARADVFGVLRDRAAVDAVVAYLARADWLAAGDFAWVPAEPLEIGVGLDLSTEDELAGELVVACADADAAERTLAALREQLDAWDERAAVGGLDLTAAAVRRGGRVEATFRLRGMRHALEDLARHLAGA